jgi:hypothetical protein
VIQITGGQFNVVLNNNFITAEKTAVQESCVERKEFDEPKAPTTTTMKEEK